jgi:uncharacterized protein YjiS (DUF1127 family)
MRALALAIFGRRAVDRRTGWPLRLLEALRVWRRRVGARRALQQIDTRTMSDAGIDPMAARYGAGPLLRIVDRRLR